MSSVQSLFEREFQSLVLVGADSDNRRSVYLVTVSIVIPVYKAAAHIQPLMDVLLPVLRGLASESELIFVDDGSPDDTVRQLAALKETLRHQYPDAPDIRIIRLKENYGQQAAVYCGLLHARGESVVTMDDDLQHPPSYLPEFLRLSRDYDLSYAHPDRDRREGSLQYGSRMRDLFFRKILGCPPEITPGSFRVISRRAVEAVRGRAGTFVYVSALLFRSLPDMKVQNLKYSTADVTTSTFGNSPSRFSLSGRILLYLKLVFYYTLPFTGWINRDAQPYVIREEL
ncbi:MAG: glycosyltransferase family 2 protein [Spirochaetales bacterium]|nr:glycosyltransferase family 2 protein [Spirochaetales bacterium]